MPYRFEVDAAAFVSTKGDVTARIEGELDQRIMQRLILQPRAEVALSAQDIPELGIGAGLRSEEHTSELQSLMRISYAGFCLKKKTNIRVRGGRKSKQQRTVEQ